MIDEKKCKSQGKARDFDGCGKLVKAVTRKYGLCPVCFKEWLISTKEGSEYLKKNVIPRAKKIVQKERKKKDKKQRQELTDWAYKLQDKINAISRLIDIGLPCLARGYHPDQMHAGHIFSRGAESQMRFNLHNIHRQSAQSNFSGNEDGLLREKLIQEYGMEYFEFLNGMRSMPPLKFSNLEYMDRFKRASEIYLELKREGKRRNWKERIEARNYVNVELAIYPSEFCVFHY